MYNVLLVSRIYFYCGLWKYSCVNLFVLFPVVRLANAFTNCGSVDWFWTYSRHTVDKDMYWWVAATITLLLVVIAAAFTHWTVQCSVTSKPCSVYGCSWSALLLYSWLIAWLTDLVICFALRKKCYFLKARRNLKILVTCNILVVRISKCYATPRQVYFISWLCS